MTPWLDDGDLQLWHGDAVDVLRWLPAGVAQTCVTSPPYWALREYDGAGADQLGLESTPDEYVDHLVAICAEIWRVLRPDGTLWLVIADSYAGGGMDGGTGRGTLRAGGATPHTAAKDGADLRFRGVRGRGLRGKDLVGIPWRVAFALQAAGWILRADIIWAKPNPMPESARDRPTKGHEYVFLLAKQARYFYDADAIAEPLAGEPHAPGNRPRQTGFGQDFGDDRATATWGNPAGRNRRSVWTVGTEPTPVAHYATYPQRLVEPCVLAGTSEAGECSSCGAPWRRQVELVGGQTTGRGQKNADAAAARGILRASYSADSIDQYRAEHRTTGWAPSCRCDAPRQPQTVLDPFIGSGTTALVARRLGRRSIGVDLSENYLRIARDRTAQLSLLAGADLETVGVAASPEPAESVALRLDLDDDPWEDIG